MKSLSTAEDLDEHLAFRGSLLTIFNSRGFQSSLPRPRRRLQLALRVEHASLAYRASQTGKQLDLRVSEGFRGAPSSIHQSLLEAALIPRRDEARERVVAYCRDEAFRERIAMLERGGRPESGWQASGTPADRDAKVDRGIPAAKSSVPQSRMPASQAMGGDQHHDLFASFQRINESYFGNAMNPPGLRWSARRTRRKMGHYEWEADVVQLSRSLDHPGVPAYVIDFVMYHELLHRSLGFRRVGGQRRVHTPEFRRLERDFEHFEAAKDFLDHLEQHIGRIP
jgi:hypothetical protein